MADGMADEYHGDIDIPPPRSRVPGRHEDQIVTAFSLAARWKAVLLIDECDLYLEKRNDASPKRNRMVSRTSDPKRQSIHPSRRMSD